MTTNDLSQVWPEWEIEKQIGRGSFGVVYQAVRRDSNLTSRAAIKIISIPQDEGELESLRADGLNLQASRAYLKEIVDEFINEIKVMEPFKGIQNIVSIEDYKVIEKTDQVGWDIYIRMELLTPFHTYICDKSLTEEEVIRLGCDICTALDICAQRNIIHRDIKPENIFVNSFGNFKLGDFGTARKMENLFGGLSQKGTYNYMAPEVISGMDYDARVDVYSLGLVLYRLMNGNRLPFLSEKQLLSPGERQGAFERRIRGEALPAPCNASKEMAEVILKACAYKPEERFENAAQMRRALQQINGGVVTTMETILPVVNEYESVSVEEAPKKSKKQEVHVNVGYVVEKGDFVEEKAESTGTSKSRILPVVAIVLSLLAFICAFSAVVILGMGLVNPKDALVMNEQTVVMETESEETTTVETDRAEEEESTAAEGDAASSEDISDGQEEADAEIKENSEAEIEKPFTFDNIAVGGAAYYHEGTDYGYNAAGELVYWCVDIEFDLPEKLRNRHVPRITCSWDKVVNGTAGSGSEGANFDSAKAGMTYAEFGTTDAVYSYTGVDRFDFLLFLPDNPDIAGSQSATVQIGDKQLTVYFDLEYEGDYVNGTGWNVTNIYY